MKTITQKQLSQLSLSQGNRKGRYDTYINELARLEIGEAGLFTMAELEQLATTKKQKAEPIRVLRGILSVATRYNSPKKYTIATVEGAKQFVIIRKA